MPGSFYVENLGCAKNQVDAEVMITALRDRGWTAVTAPDTADLIIVNTCSFIQPAREESVTSFLDLHKAYPGKKIVMAGCFSQRYGAGLSSMIPEADGIFGNADPSKIVNLIELMQESDGQPVTLLPEHGNEDEVQKAVSLSPAGSGYVKIAEGCDNRCSYCAIPIIRGPLRSRTVDSVVTEVERLISEGTFEINLIAQDLGSFGAERGAQRGELELPQLLERLSAIQGEFWVRMLYIHPDRFMERLLDICSDDQRILPYFDLPFQHSSQAVLRRMGRSGDRETYLGLIDTIRSRLPSACIRSTFLVGHPGEGEYSSSKTCCRFRGTRSSIGRVSVYSPEEGTASAEMRTPGINTLLSRRWRKRKEILEERQIPISEARLEQRIGEIIHVLVEEPIQGEDIALGRSYFTAPEVDGAVVVHSADAKEGDVIKCRLIARNGIDMEAVPYEGV